MWGCTETSTSARTCTHVSSARKSSPTSTFGRLTSECTLEKDRSSARRALKILRTEATTTATRRSASDCSSKLLVQTYTRDPDPLPYPWQKPNPRLNMNSSEDLKSTMQLLFKWPSREPVPSVGCGFKKLLRRSGCGAEHRSEGRPRQKQGLQQRQQDMCTAQCTAYTLLQYTVQNLCNTV